MPNYVMNRVVLLGKDANEVANKLLSKDNDTAKEYMDFNNIDRMPESLNIVCGSCTTPAAEYYLSSINPNNLEVRGEKVTEKEFKKILNKVNAPTKERKIYGENEFGVSERDFDTLGGARGYLTYGKTICENRMNYGCSTWYEWSKEHWGVKWNASSSRVERDLNEVTIRFETPWDGVTRLMCKIAEMFKDKEVIIKYDFSEEQIAFYDKSITFEKGDVIAGKTYEPDSKEATEHFMEIWELEDEFVYDPKTDNYKAKWLLDEKEDDSSDEDDD